MKKQKKTEQNLPATPSTDNFLVKLEAKLTDDVAKSKMIDIHNSTVDRYSQLAQIVHLLAGFVQQVHGIMQHDEVIIKNLKQQINGESNQGEGAGNDNSNSSNKPKGNKKNNS